MIKKVLFSFVITLVFAATISAQPNVLYSDLGSGWNDHTMNDRGAVLGKITQYTGSSSNLAFLFITQSGVWSPKWVGSTTNFERNTDTYYSDGIYYYVDGGWDNDLTIPVTNGNYYTFITGKNTDSNNAFSVLETNYEPVNFSLIDISETDIVVGETVDVTINLAGTLNTGEKIFIRYTNDNWANSMFVEITDFTGNTGTGTIPAPTNPGTIEFYVLSTNQTSLSHATADYFTLRYDNNSGTNYEITVSGSGSPTLTATPDGSMTENQLNDRIITLSLTDETFADDNILESNFTLNNAPVGLSIESLTYNTNTEAELALAFDGTDFDTDYPVFSITIDGTELSASANLTSNAIPITAINDQQSLDSAFIAFWEGDTEDIFYNANDFNSQDFGIVGPTTSLYLKSGQLYVWKNAGGDITDAVMNYRIYMDGETPDAFIQQSLPFHNEWAANEGTAQLWWNNEPDETDLNILEGLTEGTYYIEVYFEALDGQGNTLYFNNEGANYIAEFTYEIPSDPIVIISPDETLQEENLNDRQIFVSLTNTEFADDVLEASNFVLNNAPAGLSIETINYSNATEAVIDLEFDGTDFEENIPNFSLTILEAELTASENITSNQLTIYAEDLTAHEGINYAKIVLWEGDGSDNFYNDEDFDGMNLGNFSSTSSLYFKSGQLFTWKHNGGDILSSTMYYRFYHESETPGAFNEQDLPFDNEWIENDTTFQLWWNSGENQTDINLLETGILDGTHYIEVYFTAETTDSEIITWDNNENNFIANFTYGIVSGLQASVTEQLTETNLDGAIVNLTLIDETFSDNSIDIGNISLNNAPVGLSIESVSYVGTTQILINLAFDGTDFDTDISNFSVTITAAELTGDQDLTSNDLSILAIDEDASIWTHLLTAVDMEYTLGDNVSPWINMEIGQTIWESAEIGYGNDNEDINSFDWLNAEWYEDGEGNNKKVHAQINISGSNGTGTYYYVGRAKATPTSNWNYANNEVWSDTDVFAPEYTITINPVPDPITFEANALDGTRIELNWTADATHNNVIILAKEDSEISAVPTQGTVYAINDVIDDATVIYKGSAGSFNHMNLNQLSTYHYKAFTINNNYYSNFLTANATTTDEEACTFEISLGNDTAICGGTGIVLHSGLTVSPYGDSLTITYDASVTGELLGEDKIYFHSAAEMAPDNGWEYITGNWGDDDGVGLMTEISDDVWQISFVPVDYYGYPAEQNIYGILMKFRNADGTIEAGNAAGEDIWINMSINPPVSSFNAVQVDFTPASITSITWSTGSHEPSISISSSGEYWVSATDNQGCIGTDTINIGIQALPQADLGLDTTLCTGEDILLYPGDFEEYLWQDNSTDTSLLVTSTGTYSVTVTDEFGCQGFDVVQVQVVNPPVAYFTYNELENNTVEFIDESTDAETYAWDFESDGIIDDDTQGDVQHTFTNLGQYVVSLTVTNACTDHTHSEVLLILNIQDIFFENFTIYPNPISDYLYINSGVKFDNISFDIFDISGKIIISKKAKSTITKIDFQGLPAGMYILEINADSEITNLKIIKQ
jgi:hypothetical protein